MTTLDNRPDLALAPLPQGSPPQPTTARTTSERGGDRRDRTGLALSRLFADRGDLSGVSAVADVLAEDLLWSV